jgi:hypothetical protein
MIRKNPSQHAKSPSNFRTISARGVVLGFSTEKGFITVTCDVDGWSAYLEARRRKAETVF